MMAKFVLYIVLLSLCVAVTRSQSQKEHSKSGIKRYALRIMKAPSDTVSVDDSVRVEVEMYLDCTNKIKWTETVFDTVGKRERVVLSVYGTYVSGPYRPMCAARSVLKDFFVHFPKPGNWIIDAGPPENDHQRDEPWIIIVR